MARTRRKVRARGRVRSSSGRSYGRKRVVRNRPAGRRTTRARRGASTARKTHIVISFAGASPVREGEPVGIGQKVAAAPRVRPKF